MTQTLHNVKVKLLSPSAQVPEYATPGAAGFDLRAENLGMSGVPLAFQVDLPPGGTQIFGTDLAFQIPAGMMIRVHGRSGLGFKHNVQLANGTGIIDSDYQGELKIKLINLGDKPVQITKGDRIAQGILEFVPKAQFEAVEEFDVTTTRGENGFGSTGAA